MQLFKLPGPATLSLLLAAAGCGSKIPPTNYYSLNLPPAPVADLSGDVDPDLSLAVERFLAPDMLSQDRIVYRPSRQEVGFYEYHRWAEDPRVAIQHALMQELLARRLFHLVVPFDSRAETAYLLRGRVERLEEVDYDSGVQVRVTVAAELIESATSRVVWQDRHSASGDVGAPEVRDVVARMSEAARQSVAALADSLSAYLEKS